MDWKEHAHLFANRKFQAMTDSEVYPISGFYFGFGGGYLILENHTGHINKQVKDCTLIARKIEDMTDEETSYFGRYGYADNRQPEVWQNIRDIMSEHASKDFFSPSEFIQLLDFGFYPFDQKGFDNGTVIDIKTL